MSKDTTSHIKELQRSENEIGAFRFDLKVRFLKSLGFALGLIIVLWLAFMGLLYWLVVSGKLGSAGA